MNLKFLNAFKKSLEKQTAEEEFWSEEIQRYVQWYNGDIPEHYGVKSPTSNQKVKSYTIQQSAILTWFSMHQKIKYLADLELEQNIFANKTILDIGSGPIPSAECFNNARLYCLDPSFPAYIRSGFPIHCYQDSTKFVYGYSENIPFEDNYFDAVISVNAIDHVDDLFKTAEEIHRVLKSNGLLRIHAHYHPKTTCEPIELNDRIMKEAFSWCNGFIKTNESNTKTGAVAEKNENYTLWSNFS